MKGNTPPPHCIRHLFVALLLLFTFYSTQAQNNALIFNGSSQYVEAASLSTFDGVTNNPFTIEIWFNPEIGAPNDGTLWSLGTNSGSSLRLNKTTGGSIFLDDVDGTIITAETPSVQAERWHHAAVIYDGTEVILYIDGVEEGRATRTITLDGTGIRVGRSTLPTDDYWEGELDELRIWGTAITLEELHENLFAELKGNEANLLHYFPFNESSGTTSPDGVGGLTGTNVNMSGANWVSSTATEQVTNTAIGTSNWTDASNWSQGSVPIPLDEVQISSVVAVTVDTDINVYNLTLDISSSLTHTGFNVGISGNLSVNGGTMSSSETDTLFFHGADQSINTNFSNSPVVELSGVGTKTLVADLVVLGDLNINEGITLDANVFTVQLLSDANWNNMGTFVTNFGTVQLNGSAHTVNETNLYDLIINGTGEITFANPITISGKFEVQDAARIDMGSNQITLGNSLDFTALDTLQFLPGARFVVNQFMSPFETGIDDGTPDYYFPTLEVQSNGGVSSASNLAVYDGDSLYLTGGLYSQNFVETRLGVNSKLLVEAGSFNSSNCSTFFDENAQVIQNSGFLGFAGGDGSDFVMNAEGNSVGYEMIFNDGEIGFDDVLIAGLGGDGLTFNGGSIYQFRLVKFDEGANANSYMTINTANFDGLTLENLEFTSGATNNVSKLAGEGDLNIPFAVGTLAGPSFENVTAGSINWVDFELYDDFNLRFDGFKDYVGIDGGQPFGAEFTIEAWIFPRSVSGDRPIFSWDIDAGGGENVEFILSNGNPQFNISSSPGVSYGADQPLINSVWQHVAMSFDGANVDFYLNGQPIGSFVASSFTAATPDSTFVGVNRNLTSYFNGRIDDVRIWDVVRTPAQIQDNLCTKFTGGEANLVTFYNFDEGSGTILDDLSPSDFNGELVNFDNNGDLFSSSNWNVTQDLDESKQMALDFDGVNDNITFSSGPDYTTELSVEAWVNYDITDGQFTIASWSYDGGANARLSVENGQAKFTVFDGATTDEIVAPDVFSNNVWTHIAVTRLSDAFEIYVNGQLKATKVITLSPVGSTAFKIGSYTESVDQGFFDGEIDEVRIWDAVITQEQIQQYAISEDLTLHPNVTKLRAHYKFNDGLIPEGDNGTQAQLMDDRGNFDGTLEGFLLSGSSSSNWVSSGAFDAINVSVQGNNIVISSQGDNTPSELDNTQFGLVPVNDSTARQFLVINEGFNEVLLNESFNSSFPQSFDKQVIAPFDTAIMTVNYTPFSTGLSNGTVTVSYANSSSSRSYFIKVEGTGYPDEEGAGQALSFTGFASVSLDNNGTFTRSFTEPFTMEAWVNVSGTGNYQVFNNAEFSTGGDGYTFSIESGQLRLTLVGDQDIADQFSALSVGSTDIGFWNHVAVTYDGSNSPAGIKMYINGVEETTTTSGSALGSDINGFNAQPTLGSSGFNGIDEFRMWNVVRTGDEIFDNLHNGIDFDANDLQVYYRMDEGSGVVLSDLTGNADGTFSITDISYTPSNVPLSNSDIFNNTFEKAGIWNSSVTTGGSLNFGVIDNGFLSDEGDHVILAHNNQTAGIDEFTTDGLSVSLPFLVDERLRRGWKVAITDSTSVQQGGLLQMSFAGVASEADSTKTFFLLQGLEEANLYTLASYYGYTNNASSITFLVEADSLNTDVEYTLGRSLDAPGLALAFDGINDLAATIGDISISDEFSYEAWINIDPSSNLDAAILSLGNGGINHFELKINSTGNLVARVFASTAETTVSAMSGLNDGNWHHVAFVRDKTGGTSRMYIDGVEDASISNTISGGFAMVDQFNIGQGITTIDAATFKIDEFRLWNVVRSETEIQTNRNSTIAVENPDLALYYRFDQLSNNLPDHSAFSQPTQVLNFDFDFATSGWIVSDAFSSDPPQNALDFDGIEGSASGGDYVEVAHQAALNLAENDFTLEAWVFPVGGTNETILSKGHGGGGSNPDTYTFQIQDGNIALELSDGTAHEWILSDADVPLNKWSHVAAVYENATNSVTFYLNGINVGGGTYSLTPSNNGDTMPMYIGRQGHTCDCNYFGGAMDEVRIWNIIRDEDQIRAGLFKEADPAEFGLIAYYNFNQGIASGDNTGITEVNEETNGYEGTLVNFALTGTTSNFVESTAFDFTAELSITVNGVTFNRNDEVDFGVLVPGEEVFVEVIVSNTGLDTLNIGNPVYGSNINLFDDTDQVRLDPFESDTARFEYRQPLTGRITGESFFSLTNDDPLGDFILTSTSIGYPSRPGGGDALVLDGVVDHVISDQSIDLLQNRSFSVEFWAQWTDNATDNIVFSHGPATGVDYSILDIGFKSGNVISMDFQGQELTHTWTEANDEWNHFAFTYDSATNEMEIFINGLSVATATSMEDFGGSGEFYIGSRTDGTDFFEGSIDELRIWNFSLPDSVIQTHLPRKLGDSNDDFFLDSLIASYRFEGGLLPEVLDVQNGPVYSNYHMTLQSGTTALSGAFIGDGSISTYEDNELDTSPFGETVKVANIATPANGVHLFVVDDASANDLSTDVYKSIALDRTYGVFAPNNTFDFNIGSGSIGTTDSLRIATRPDITGIDFLNASNLFGVDIAEDSVRAFSQTSGNFTLARINYPARIDAGTALSFNGVDQQVDISTAPIDEAGDFTVEMWAQVASGAATGQFDFYRQEDPTGGGTPAIFIAGIFDQKMYFFFRETNGGTSGTGTGNTDLNDDEWHHLAYVRQGTNLSLYIDGVLDNTATIPFGTTISFPESTTPVIDGNANLDEMRIWNAALSASELRAYSYTNELSDHPQLTNLKAYYRFDDDVNSTQLLDLAASNHGILANHDPASDWIASGAFAFAANTVVTLADSGPGSFRATVEAANLTPTMDTIRFDLPGDGPWVIPFESTVEVTDSLYIDGASQPGWDLVTGNLVEFNGSDNATNIGVYAQSDYIEVYGIQFNGFTNIGLYLENESMQDAKVGKSGGENIFINNAGSGLHIIDADGTVVFNNLIGITWDDLDGANDIGIFIGGTASNSVVGSTSSELNVIEFNRNGVEVADNTALGNLLRQNVIARNTGNGILLRDGGNNEIAAPVITDVDASSVTGTGVDGQEIDVYFANDAIGSNQATGYLGTVTVSGTDWTLTGVSILEAEYVTATANTAADGTSGFATRVQFAIPPADPTVTGGLFNTLEPMITGTFEDGTELDVTIDGVTYVLGTDAALTDDAAGNWTLNLTGSPLSREGLFDVEVTSTKTIVSLSANDQTTDEVEIDVTAPVTPTVVTQVTNNNQPTLTGTYETGTDLQVTVDATTYVFGTDPELTDPSSDGNWSLALAVVLADDIYDVTVTSTDAAGNMSTDGTASELEVDTVVPTTPTVNDLVINTDRPMLTGSYELGTTLTVRVTGVIVYQLGAAPELTDPLSDGNWQLDLSTLASGLPEDTYDVEVTSTDAAANAASDITTDELIIDLTPPTVPTVDALATNIARPTITGTYDFNTVELTVMFDGVTYTLDTDPELTDPSSDGNWSLDLSTLATDFADDTYEVVVTSNDEAGNISVDATTEEVIIDATPPAVPTVNMLITANQRPTIQGTYETDTDLQVTVNGTIYVLGIDAELTDPLSDGFWSLDLSGLATALAEDVYEVEVSTTDVGGNSSNDATSNELTIDITPPTDPTVNSLITNSDRPTITGTYDFGTSLFVELDGSLYTLDTDPELTDPLSNGVWSLDLSSLATGLAENTYNVMVSSFDLAGNTAVDATTDELQIDLTAPSVPTVAILLTNSDRPTLVGTYDVGTDLTVVVDGNLFSLTLSAELTDPLSDGNWSLDLSGLATGLADGTYDVFASSSDDAGNSTPDATTDELVVDLTAPVITVDNLLTKVTSPELTGTITDPLAAISVDVDGNTYVATNNGDATWTLAAGTISPALTAGTYEVAATATDPATNVGTDATSDELIVAGAPQANPANPVAAFSFTARWDAVGGISSYAFEVSRDNAFTDLVTGFDNVAVTGTSEEVTGLEYGTAYFYRLRSILAVGDTSSYSNTISVSTDRPTETIADSLALVSIYDALGGDDWLNNTNWLVAGQRIGTWTGVTVVNGRVTDIALSDNNLVGEVPDFTTGELSEVTTLLLNGNAITSLSDLTVLTSLTDLQVQNNNLDFSSLIGNVGITGIVYTPQADILEEQTLFINEGDDIVIDRSSGNPGDEYQWFRDGGLLADESNETLQLTAVSFDDEGSYNATITNPGANLLTLTTRPVILKVSSLERDSLALRNIYLALDGDNWEKDGAGYNWLTDPVTSWLGLSFNGDRVIGVDISASDISGSMPDDILDVLNLTTIDFSGNDIVDIPDMTSLDQLTSLNLDDNLLQFDDLLPNVGITGISYLNQELGDISTADTLSRGSDFELMIEVGGTDNDYEWRLNDVAVGAPSAANLLITDLRRENMGTYTVAISNSGVPGLVFTSQERVVLAKAFIEGTVRQSETEAFSDGIIKFLQVQEQAYDTIQRDIPIASDGSYSFETVLADYVILASPNDLETFIPTYHAGTIQWDEANVVMLNNDTTGIDIVMVPIPTEPGIGDGTAAGLIETDFPDETDGRIEARRKVRRVGVALRRRRSTGRTQNDDFELFAYTQTDDEGLFSFENIPAGVYRIFIEYPGIPIREDAFTEFEVTEDGKNNDVAISATVFEDGIEIIGTITGVLKDLIDDLVIYPNPSSTGEVFVQIEASRSFEVMLEIVDLRGKTIMAETLNNINIGNGTRKYDVSRLPAGLYIIRVTAPSQQNQLIYSGKLILQNN